MTYWTLNVIFLSIAVLALAVAVWRRRLTRRVAIAVVGTTVALVLLTAVFDNLMIGVGLFDYSPEGLSGVHVGLAPLEDFAYPIAAAVLLPALWLLLGGSPNRVHDPNETHNAHQAHDPNQEPSA